MLNHEEKWDGRFDELWWKFGRYFISVLIVNLTPLFLLYLSSPPFLKPVHLFLLSISIFNPFPLLYLHSSPPPPPFISFTLQLHLHSSPPPTPLPFISFTLQLHPHSSPPTPPPSLISFTLQLHLHPFTFSSFCHLRLYSSLPPPFVTSTYICVLHLLIFYLHLSPSPFSPSFPSPLHPLPSPSEKTPGIYICLVTRNMFI